MSTKYNYYEPSPSFNQDFVYSTNHFANTFTPALDYDVDYIVIHGLRSGASGDLTMNLYEADGAHKPNIGGGSLGSVVKAQGDIPEVSSEITFTFASPVSVSNGQEYAIVLSGDTFTSVWEYRFIHPATQDGYRTTSSNSGSSWSTAANNYAYWHQVWGTAAGNSPVDTPSPADSATGQQSGSVDLSWADPNDPDFDDYEVYFGPTGSMVLVETGYATMSLTISDDMILGQEYSWRIDGNDGVDVVTGSVWTFTVEGFLPPSTNLTDKKRLVVASFNQIWYEDIA